MSVKAKAKMRAAGRLQARQSGSPLFTFSSSSAASDSAATISTVPSYKQPTTVIPLTTTFTPPASCTENRLSQLPPPGYFIWANEPIPAANHTSTACYPSEFLGNYRSVSSGLVGSSVVPPMSPLACPVNYCTQFVGDNNYMVCCPSGYDFARPTTTVDPNRPGYGGTCYSPLTMSSTVTLTAYNTSGSTFLADWHASRTDEQAYAHPIDGFATSKPSVKCYSPPPNRTGAIAGISVGAVMALASVVGFVWLILRYIQRRRTPPPVPLKVQHTQYEKARSPEYTSFNRYEKQEDSGTQEIGTSGEQSTFRLSRLNSGKGPFEMIGDTVAELDAGDPLGKKIVKDPEKKDSEQATAGRREIED